MSTVMRRRFIRKLFDDQNALWTTTCPGISWISHEEYFIDTLFKDVYPDVFERDSSSTAAMMDLPSCTDVKAHQGVSGFFLFFFLFWWEPSLDRFDRNCNRLKLEFKNTTRERERERERRLARLPCTGKFEIGLSVSAMISISTSSDPPEWNYQTRPSLLSLSLSLWTLTRTWRRNVKFSNEGRIESCYL